MAGGMSFAKRREALELASRALEAVDQSLWQAQGGELGPFMALVDRLGEQVGGARVAVLSEAVARGETGDKPGSVHTWLLEWAPSLRSGGSAELVKVVDASREQRYAQLREALLQARVPVGNAACVVEEFERLRHRLHPDAHEDAMGVLVALAENGRRRDIRRLRQDLVARYGHHGELQAEHDRLRERTSLSQPIGDGGGLFDYHLVVDAEAKAVIEAAVGPLSAPRPVEGEPDRRPSGQRRLEALLDVVRRGVASADGVATTPKSQLFVTMALDDLVARANAGTVVGSADARSLLGPETVRRLACDAGLVPVVLGGRGEVLEMGRSTRYFTEAQVRALWLRDGGRVLGSDATPLVRSCDEEGVQAVATARVRARVLAGHSFRAWRGGGRAHRRRVVELGAPVVPQGWRGESHCCRRTWWPALPAVRRTRRDHAASGLGPRRAADRPSDWARSLHREP